MDKKHDQSDDSPKGQLVHTALIDTGYVRLPFNDEQFNEFIRGLLGRPQSNSRLIVGPFEIDHSDLSQIHNLISQRLQQQNRGHLVLFHARITFNDGSSVDFSDFVQLETYKATRALIPIELQLQWDYLVQFTDKIAPEKQSVRVGFCATAPSKGAEGDRLSQRRELNGFFTPPETMNYQILHTARTWGTDMDALLAGQLSQFVVREGRLRQLGSMHSGKVGVVVTALSLVSVLLGLAYSLEKIASANRAALQSAIESNNQFEILSHVGRLLSDGLWTKLSLAAFISIALAIIVSVVLGVIATSAVSKTSPSFILMTDEAKKFKAHSENEKKESIVRLAISLLGALLHGLLTNFVWAKVFE